MTGDWAFRPSFTASREQHGRQYSAEKRSPWRIRANCKCDFIMPGEPHRLVTEPGPGGTRGEAIICEAAYRAARRAEQEPPPDLAEVAGCPRP